MIGIGVASGPNRANEALHAAISSPLLEDATLEGATGVLCHIRYGSASLTMTENRQVNELLTDAIDEDADLTPGSVRIPAWVTTSPFGGRHRLRYEPDDGCASR